MTDEMGRRVRMRGEEVVVEKRWVWSRVELEGVMHTGVRCRVRKIVVTDNYRIKRAKC